MEDKDWVFNEVQSENFGDQRLNKRYGCLLNSLASSPNKSIPASCNGWGETIAAYRFFNHEDVTEAGILAPHKKATLERIKNEKIVLIPQDTTQIDFTGRKSLSGIGYLSKESGQGFYIHPSIAFTPERCCLGTIDFQLWIREQLGSREQRKNKPIEEKETYCWLKGYEAANSIAKAAPDTAIISVCVREGDIYDVLSKTPNEHNKAYWLIRCKHDRKVLNEIQDEFKQRLKQTINGMSAIGHIEFDVPTAKVNRNSKARHYRTGRRVKQEIRASQVVLEPPQASDRKFNPTSVYIVHCKEINVPDGEIAIEWYLLTSFPTHTVEDAKNIINWYLCRWQIEVFFKVLKSGCKIEELQFESLRSTSNCLALYMIVAWRILYLTMMGRACPDVSCSTLFEDCEWRSVYSIVKKEKPPKEPPSLYSIIIMIAKLGGFLARKSDGFPGPKVMWQGLQRMQDFAVAWNTFHEIGDL